MSHAPEEPRGSSPCVPGLWGQGHGPGRAHLGEQVIDDRIVQDGAGPVIQQLEAVGVSQSTPVGEKEPEGESWGGSAPHPAQPISHRSPQGPGLGTVGQACPQGLYLILYTTTWLQDSSTVKRWLGGNQQLRSSVARAKSG